MFGVLAGDQEFQGTAGGQEPGSRVPRTALDGGTVLSRATGGEEVSWMEPGEERLSW
jgi:hypothetical protein